MPEHIDEPGCRCWGCVSSKATAAARPGSVGRAHRPAGNPNEELIRAVNALTRSTPHGMDREREDGTAYTHFLLEDPLLTQLRAAIRPGMEQGGGASGGRPAPLAVNALDLYLDIEQTTHTFYWLHYSPGGHRQTLEAMIQSWAATASAREQTAKEALKVIGGWVARIRALFDPGKSIELQGACPAEDCGARYYSQEDDGEQIRKPALTAHPAAARPFAVCGACGARWEGELELNVLATLMHTAKIPPTQPRKAQRT